MRLDDIYVRGTGLRLPYAVPRAVPTTVPRAALDTGPYAVPSTGPYAATPVDDACDRWLAASAGFPSMARPPEESMVQMAVVAARQAVRGAGTGPGEIDLLLHADPCHKGGEPWPVASYIQRELGCAHGPALEIRQRTNAGMAALDLAVAYLTSPYGHREALLTTAVRRPPPGADRWRTDLDPPSVDGVSALALSRRDGYARLCSLSVFADPELARGGLGEEPCPPVFPDRWTVRDGGGTEWPWSADLDPLSVAGRADGGQRAVLEEALADADLTLADADWVVLPPAARRAPSGSHRPLAADPARTTGEFRTTGKRDRRAGRWEAGDPFVGLHQLVRTGRARPGHRLVLTGVGAGHSWGCAVLEMVRQPFSNANTAAPF